MRLPSGANCAFQNCVFDRLTRSAGLPHARAFSLRPAHLRLVTLRTASNAALADEALQLWDLRRS
jgi:hypothetical protein